MANKYCQSFEKADALLGKRSMLKVNNNTHLIRLDVDTIGLRLHETFIVRYHRDGRIVLNTGGWRTSTTKTRINDYAPIHIYQEKFNWYIGNQFDRWEFQEGMTYTSERGWEPPAQSVNPIRRAILDPVEIEAEMIASLLMRQSEVYP